MRYWGRVDEVLAAVALSLMVLIPLVEMVGRPITGRSFENAPLFVQHMGLVMAMWGAVAAQRHGHLTSLGRCSSAAKGLRVWPPARFVAV